MARFHQNEFDEVVAAFPAAGSVIGGPLCPSCVLQVTCGGMAQPPECDCLTAAGVQMP
jgi:hypothetical protein